MVASAERIADRRQAQSGQFFGQAHRHLARTGNVSCPFLTEHIADFDAVIFRNGINNNIGGDDFVLLGNNVLQSSTRQIDVDDGTVHKAAARSDAVERAFKLTHVGTDQIGNEQRGFVFNTDARRFRLFLQNGDTHFQFGRLEFQSQSP
ncbi:Uncharacterised protein [Neisseria meningitidis]|nr:Uncharacterised protein [Neisseria meningitidis]CWR62858.1 Uncharacterised protein [Neisseria meningitidis]